MLCQYRYSDMYLVLMLLCLTHNGGRAFSIMKLSPTSITDQIGEETVQSESTLRIASDIYNSTNSFNTDGFEIDTKVVISNGTSGNVNNNTTSNKEPALNTQITETKLNNFTSYDIATSKSKANLSTNNFFNETVDDKLLPHTPGLIADDIIDTLTAKTKSEESNTTDSYATLSETRINDNGDRDSNSKVIELIQKTTTTPEEQLLITKNDEIRLLKDISDDFTALLTDNNDALLKKLSVDPIYENNYTPIKKLYQNIERRKGESVTLSINEGTEDSMGDVTMPTIIPSIADGESKNSFDTNNSIKSLERTQLSSPIIRLTPLKYEPMMEGDIKRERVGIKHDNIEDIKNQLMEEAILNERTLRQQMAPDYMDIKDKQKTKVTNMVVLENNKLSVKPIIVNSESKNKSSSLYVIKSSYRRPKKLEITAPKPYLHDPNDNSWRNESINSLGIVFKANNATKPFSLVVKNKTDTDINLNVPPFTNEYNNTPQLKDRLERLSEMRKTKKKKPNEPEINNQEFSFFDITTDEVVTETISNYDDEKSQPELMKKILVTHYSDQKENHKPKKVPPIVNMKENYNFFEDLELMFDQEKMRNLDLKKASVPIVDTEMLTTISPNWKPFKIAREPTLEYFPPRTTTIPHSDTYTFDSRLDKYIVSTTTTTETPISNPLPKLTYKPTLDKFDTIPPKNKVAISTTTESHKSYDWNHNEQRPEYELVNSDVSLDRNSFIIRHFRDFINDAIRAGQSEQDQSGDSYIPSFKPFHIVIPDDLQMGNYYNKERVNEDYNSDITRHGTNNPTSINNGIVHKMENPSNRMLESSNTFLKRILNDDPLTGSNVRNYIGKRCDPHCEKIRIELSPDYELHYYIPEEEQKYEVDTNPISGHNENYFKNAQTFYDRDGL